MDFNILQALESSLEVNVDRYIQYTASFFTFYNTDRNMIKFEYPVVDT